MALVLPALLSLFSIYKRHQAESLNRATAFAVEYETVESLAAAQGVPMERAIADLKAQGVNALVLSEESVAELLQRGRASITSQYVASGNGGMVLTSLQFADPRDLSRVQRGLQIRLQRLAGTLAARNGLLPLPPVSPAFARSVAIGLNPEQADVAKQNGLLVIARCGNPAGVSAKTVQDTLQWAHEMGATIFLPQGDQVLGRRDAIPTTIDTLKALGMMYASPEFAKLGGDDEMVRKAPDNVVRLHSAQSAELDRLTLPDAVERYTKAARERNMRVLLIRPVSYGAEMPLADFASFVKQIHDGVVREGGAVGVPKPFTEPHLPRWFSVLIALSIVPAGYFVGAAFFPDRRVQMAGLALLTLLAVAGVTHAGQQIDALLATLIFPVAAFLVLDALRPRNVALGFAIVTAISLVGGLCVAGMLNGLPFYVKAQEFSGVKISIFLPILIVGSLFLHRLGDLRQIGKSPITWGTAALGLVVVAVLGLMIARTGNDSGVGASGGEMVFRNLLDRFLFVRPRTKEFMIGHPLLVVGIGLLSYLTRRPSMVPKLGGWATLLIMVGSMGQTSVVNTLTHLHIPVVLSLARVGLGAVIGCMIGLGLWAIVSRRLPEGEEA